MAREKMANLRIVQISPAPDGWTTCYESELDDDEPCFHSPVAVWALMEVDEGESEREVHGLIDMEGYLGSEEADSPSSFGGYIHRSEMEKHLEMMKKRREYMRELRDKGLQ